MPVSRRYASAFRATWRGSRVKSWRVTGSTMLAMTLTVGLAKNGSRRVVVGVGDGHHVGLVDAHPAANRRAVEAEAFLERALVEMFDRERTVLPAAEHVDELQVDHLGLVRLGELEEIVGRRRVGIGGHGSSSLATAPTLRQARLRRNRELANDSFVRASERPQERFSEGRGNIGRPLIG